MIKLTTVNICSDMPTKKKVYIPVPLEEWNELRGWVKEVKSSVEKILYEKQKELITPKEVCAMLRIGRTTYRRYVDKGIIIEIQPGGKNSRVFVRKSEIEKLQVDGII